MEGVSIELSPRIRQETLLAPQLRASLRVLQMDHQALAEELRHEAETNPVVEIDDAEEMPTVTDELAAEERREDDERDEFEQDDDFNTSVTIDEAAAERRQRFFDRQVAIESLQEHLLAQVPQAGFTEAESELAEYLIGDIDDDGRYVGSLVELVDVLGVSAADLDRVLGTIQRFDPPGVGARDLRECLLIQAKELEVPAELRGLLCTLITEHLESVAAGECGRIAAKLGISAASCEAAIKVLRSLEPKPGRPYQAHGRLTQYIRPELAIVLEAGKYVLKSCAYNLPSFNISPFYQAMLDDTSTPPETQQYLRERIGSAMLLQEAISRRGETVMRIAEAIFDVQRDFFTGGFDALKPLTIEEVAKRTGYHGTTVGRAVRGKYIRTPRGVFELKRFFCVGKLECAAEGGCVSAIAVKRKIAALVSASDGQRLTDETLSELLGKDGVRISRRTVAKYREEMGLTKSSLRGKKGSTR